MNWFTRSMRWMVLRLEPYLNDIVSEPEPKSSDILRAAGLQKTYSKKLPVMHDLAQESLLYLFDRDLSGDWVLVCERGARAHDINPLLPTMLTVWENRRNIERYHAASGGDDAVTERRE